MIISDELQVLFIHIQKTGGTSLMRVLEAQLPDARRKPKGLLRHATMAEAMQRYPELSDYWTCGFVRNPWARLHSWHRMIVRRGEAAEQDPTGMVAQRVAYNPLWSGVLARYRSFDAFILEAPHEFPELARPQIDYLRTDTRSADFVGRTENLDQDLQTLAETLGLAAPPRAPRSNAGGYVDYRSAYDDTLAARVSEAFATDIARFDYQF